MLKIAVMVLALVNATFAVTAWFYDATDCPGKKVVGTCTNLQANVCCTDQFVNPASIWSAYLNGIGNNYGMIAINVNNQCSWFEITQHDDCLMTGSHDIYGAYWSTTSPTGNVLRKRDSKAGSSECNASQHFDIYHIGLPGEERKPYSAAVAEQFDHAGVVDWDTRSFKVDKIDVVQGIIAQNGHGLNDDQLAVISENFQL